MKKTFFLLFGVLLIGSVAPEASHAATPASGVEFRFGYFYRPLLPYGEWIVINDGMYVWRPLHMRRSWRPYMLGRWMWTDYGWYWVSSEPFGWVTYHYGRWTYDDYCGWIWVPDDVWGPAWVEWRYDDAYVGWAPLPPFATFHVSVGISFGHRWAAPARYWNFVGVNRFGDEIRYRDVVPESRARRLIGVTRTQRSYEMRGDRVFNAGVDRTFFEQHGRRRFERTEVIDRTDRQGEQIVRPGGAQRIERIETMRPNDRDLRTAPGTVTARRGDRRISNDVFTPATPPRTEPGAVRTEPQRRPEAQPAPEPQRPQRERQVQPESRPKMERRTPTRERSEMRRDLMERFDRQRPAPNTRTREAEPSPRREPSNDRRERRR